MLLPSLAVCMLSISSLPSSLSPTQVANITRVSTLPGVPDTDVANARMHAAYVSVDPAVHAHLHFSLFEGDLAESPVIFYFCGGPGVPGLGCWGAQRQAPLYMPLEGPTSLARTPANQSWTQYATVIFIDAPVHVGFSTASAQFYTQCTSCPGTPDFAAHAVSAMDQISDRFGLRTRSLYVMGLSYGGKYVPAVADRILSNGGALASDLAGLVLMSPLTDPLHQLSAGMAEYYANFGLIGPSHTAEFASWQAQVGALITNQEFKSANAEFKNFSNTLASAAGGEV